MITLKSEEKSRKIYFKLLEINKNIEVFSYIVTFYDSR